MLSAAVLLAHRDGGCTGCWRLAPRAEGFHWRCQGCGEIWNPARVNRANNRPSRVW